jgi:hypothetical protein
MVVVCFQAMGNDFPAVAGGNIRYGVLDGLSNHGSNHRPSVFGRPT